MKNPFSTLFASKKKEGLKPNEKVVIKPWKDTTVKSVKKNKSTHPDDSTQRYLPFSEIRDNVIIMKDGSARMVMKVEAINFLLKSEQEQDAIIYSYQHFLNSLQFPIQILVRSLKVDIEWYLNRLKIMTSQQKNQLLKDQSERYVEFLTNLINVAQIMKKEFYIIIPHDEENNESVSSKWMFQIVKSFFSGVSQSVSIEDMRKNVARSVYLKKRLMEKTSMIKGSLEFVWLRSNVLTKDQLIELMISYYDPKVNSVSKVLDSDVHYDITG